MLSKTLRSLSEFKGNETTHRSSKDQILQIHCQGVVAMKTKHVATLSFSLLIIVSPLRQTQGQNTNVPKPGIQAPVLELNHLLQTHNGAKVNWPSLRGKTVVLEFWATWCAPCVAEIPDWNALAASVDPTKVQFISVDDEDPALVEKFLQKKPITGLIGIDTTSKVFERFGVVSRPMTVVVGPDGRVVSTTAHLEQLTRENLLAIAKKKPVDLTATTGQTPVNAKALAERNATLAQAFSAEPATAGGAPVYEVSVTPGDAGDGHVMQRGTGQMDITNSPVKLILQMAEGIPSSRITVVGVLPDKPYNLHVNAPAVDPAALKLAVEAAITAGTGVKIEHHSEVADAYVLTATPEAKEHMDDWKYPGGAMFNPKEQMLMCIHPTPDQLATGLESALRVPVVNETALEGKLKMVNLTIVPRDIASAQKALQALGFTLTPAKRTVDTVVLTPASVP
jgi:thiol-disulfide isomerase/thioredoxin